MPSKSKAQHRLMEAVAHDPGFAKRAGIPQSVGRDFVNADMGLLTMPLKKRKNGRASR